MGVRTRGLDIKAGAMRTATEKAARAEAEGVVQRWNEQLALGRDMLWSPTIRAALLAGTPWLSKGAGFLFSIRSRRAATTIPGAERIKTSVGRFLDAVLIFLVPALLPGENMFPIFLMPPFYQRQGVDRGVPRGSVYHRHDGALGVHPATACYRRDAPPGALRASVFWKRDFAPAARVLTASYPSDDSRAGCNIRSAGAHSIGPRARSQQNRCLPA
jgi:hypothetical protein